MRIFTPKGSALRDFCYLNLYVTSDNHTYLLAEKNLINKLRLSGLIKTIEFRSKRIKNVINNERRFELKYIKGLFSKPTDDCWDVLLDNSIIWWNIKYSLLNTKFSTRQELNGILGNFVTEIQARYTESNELLHLSNKIKIQEIGIDLLHLEAKLNSNSLKQ